MKSYYHRSTHTIAHHNRLSYTITYGHRPTHTIIYYHISWRKRARRDPCKFTRHSPDANSQDLSTAMTVISANIEGLTASKASMTSEMCQREHYHCLCLQERLTEHHILQGRITGMTLVAGRLHIKYGSAILIRSDLNVKGVSVWEQDNVELICCCCMPFSTILRV